ALGAVSKSPGVRRGGCVFLVHGAGGVARGAAGPAGSSSAIKTAMMEMTTRSSISVKPPRPRGRRRGFRIMEILPRYEETNESAKDRKAYEQTSRIDEGAE